jgi:HPt (histidine-containing phosphotransfer) domain-containing protein
MTDPDRILDLAHLRQYTAGDPELEAALTAAFDESCGQFLPGLTQLTDDRAWRQAAHGLKGASRGIGAFALGDVCE